VVSPACRPTGRPRSRPNPKGQIMAPHKSACLQVKALPAPTAKANTPSPASVVPFGVARCVPLLRTKQCLRPHQHLWYLSAWRDVCHCFVRSSACALTSICGTFRRGGLRGGSWAPRSGEPMEMATGRDVPARPRPDLQRAGECRLCDPASAGVGASQKTTRRSRWG